MLRVIFKYDATSIGFENFGVSLTNEEKEEVRDILKEYTKITEKFVKDELNKYDILYNLGSKVYSVFAFPSLVGTGMIKVFIKLANPKSKFLDDIVLEFLENVLLQEFALTTEDNRTFILIPISSLRLN